MDFAGCNGLVKLSEMIVKHAESFVEKKILLAFHEVATFFELNRKDGVLLLGKFLTPDEHYFFDLKRTIAELCAVHDPFSVRVSDVVDGQFEFVSADVELVDESRLGIVDIGVVWKLDVGEAPDSVFL